MSDTGSIRIPRPANLTPLLLTLTGSLAIGAFTFAWNTRADVIRLQAEVGYLREKGKEAHDSHREEIERLRTWIRNHRHAGAALASAEPPAPAEDR